MRHVRHQPFSAHGASGVLYGGARLGAPLTPLWFLSALWFSLVAYKALERAGSKVLATGAVALLVAAWLRQGLLPHATLPLSMDAALVGVPYVWLGRLSREHRLYERTGWLAALAAVFALGAAARLLAGFVPPPVDIRVGLYGSPVLGPILALGGISAAVLLAQRLGRASAPFVLVSKASVAVLASHFIVVAAFDRFLPRAPHVLEFAAALGFSLACYALILRLPLARRLFLGAGSLRGTSPRPA